MIWCELEFFPNGRDVRGEKTFYRMAQSAAGALFDFVVLNRGRHNFNVVHVPNTNDIDEEGVKNIQVHAPSVHLVISTPHLINIGIATPR